MDPHAAVIQDILKSQQVTPERGLSARDAGERLDRMGPNRLREHKQRGPLAIFVEQFKSLVILLLLAAAAAAFAFDRVIESIAIGVALLVNAVVGFGMEYQATRSMSALRELGGITARVRRDGKIKNLNAAQLVPGDIVLLEAGDRVTADLRLIEAANLQLDESALTGESVPVDKSTNVLEKDVELAARTNMAYKGTNITGGSGAGVVVATGMDTAIGHISALVEESEEESTPLEKRLEALGRRLIVLTLALAVLVAAAGLLAGHDPVTILETAIALAVAAVPEGLPVVATIALAKGMRRMARSNAIVKKLSAVEALGSATAILTDKTGTLTENRLKFSRLSLMGRDISYDWKTKTFGDYGDPVKQDTEFRRSMEIGVLCSNASLDDDGATGDPIEVALLEAAESAAITREALVKEYPEEREEAFSSETNMMATIHRAGNRFRYAVKGAPEAVVAAATFVANGSDSRPLDETARRHWLEKNETLASRGLRLLALAEKYETTKKEEPYTGLTIIGLAGLLDPPRAGVADAIGACRRAGIRVIMVTGDHAATASHIGEKLGITGPDRPAPIEGKELGNRKTMNERERQLFRSAAIFARVDPEQKLNIVSLEQEAGAVVAMTGDGINDAPALKKADVGIAMGRRGTEVAREAADMVLRDDAFTTIVTAIEQGRTIFNNIRKFIVYLLSGNLGEIIAVSASAVAGAPIPLLPLQILYINFVNDVLPALALGTTPSDRSVMEQPPRKRRQPLVSAHSWFAIVGYGVIIAGSALLALAGALLWLDLPLPAAVTVSFLTFGFARLWHVFNMRSVETGVFRNAITANGFIWLSLTVGIILLLAAVYLPILGPLLGTKNPGAAGWLVVIVCSLLPLFIIQVMKRKRLLWESHWME